MIDFLSGFGTDIATKVVPATASFWPSVGQVVGNLAIGAGSLALGAYLNKQFAPKQDNPSSATGSKTLDNTIAVQQLTGVPSNAAGSNLVLYAIGVLALIVILKK